LLRQKTSAVKKFCLSKNFLAIKKKYKNLLKQQKQVCFVLR